LRIPQLAAGSNIIENCWCDEVSGFMSGDADAATVEQHSCASLRAPRYRTLDSVLALRRYDGAHMDALVEPVPDFEASRHVGDCLAERPVRISDGDRHGDRETPLSGTSEGRITDDLSSHLQICIGHDHNMVFGAALALDSLAIGRAMRIDVLRYRGRPDEAQSPNRGMMDQSINRSLASVHQAHDSGRQAKLVQELENAPQ